MLRCGLLSALSMALLILPFFCVGCFVDCANGFGCLHYGSVGP